MDKIALRKKLAKALRKPDVPEPLWQHLDDGEGSLVEEALNPDYEDGWDTLLKEAKKALRLIESATDSAGSIPRRLNSSQASPGRRPLTEPGVNLSPYESKRTIITSLFFAKQAGAMPRVRRFRTTILGGALLSRQHAEAFLSSPAPRYLTRTQFEALGIPIVGHQSTLEDWKERRGWITEVTLRIEWPGGRHCGTFKYDRRLLRQLPRAVQRDMRPPKLHYAHDGMADSVEVWPEAVFGELSAISERLAPLYQWEKAEATRFVLTDRLSIAWPIRVKSEMHFSMSDETIGVHVYKRPRITLTVEPWVSAESVVRIYRVEQRRLLGRDNCPVGDRGLKLVEFLAEHMDDLGGPWRVLRAAWNRKHPEWLYKGDDRLFARDVRRAVDALFFPKIQGGDLGEDLHP